MTQHNEMVTLDDMGGSLQGLLTVPSITTPKRPGNIGPSNLPSANCATSLPTLPEAQAYKEPNNLHARSLGGRKEMMIRMKSEEMRARMRYGWECGSPGSTICSVLMCSPLNRRERYVGGIRTILRGLMGLLARVTADATIPQSVSKFWNKVEWLRICSVNSRASISLPENAIPDTWYQATSSVLSDAPLKTMNLAYDIREIR
ncbi:hypothetical protein B0H13DRAFT_1926834 [Mycena leptocephala]|nr:hypothetical protein B0H13DRAFT_1926834 [Mycena leptocephala]